MGERRINRDTNRFLSDGATGGAKCCRGLAHRVALVQRQQSPSVGVTCCFQAHTSLMKTSDATPGLQRDRGVLLTGVLQMIHIPPDEEEEPSLTASFW